MCKWRHLVTKLGTNAYDSKPTVKHCQRHSEPRLLSLKLVLSLYLKRNTIQFIPKIIQVTDSIPWVRCAYGNVWMYRFNLCFIQRFLSSVVILPLNFLACNPLFDLLREDNVKKQQSVHSLEIWGCPLVDAPIVTSPTPHIPFWCFSQSILVPAYANLVFKWL